MNAMDRQPRRVVADKVTMAHGGGGKAMRDLIEDVFTSVFCPPGMEDQARLMDDALTVPGARLACFTNVRGCLMSCSFGILFSHLMDTRIGNISPL